MSEREISPGDQARGLVRAAGRATLATVMAPGEDGGPDGAPYASLALAACGHDGAPLLLISELSDHARNIAADPRVSLLFENTRGDTGGRKNPLTGTRVSVLGRAEKINDDRLRARYLARHPTAAIYAGFSDFALWRVAVERVRLIAGFGDAHWLTGDEMLYDCGPAATLAETEADIVAHMNADHADAVGLYAHKLLGLRGKHWTLVGIDPEGCDLRRDGTLARLGFAAPVRGPKEARAALVALADKARAI